MSLLFYKAYRQLIGFEIRLRRGDFQDLCDKVRNCPLGEKPPQPGIVERISSAVDLAAIWYPKQVLCLQRSAATVCLLKAHGVRAQMVIGAQQMPFRAHAWVEVAGRVVNDKPYIPEIYAVLDRC
jgi:hypothetical protein